MERSDIRDHRSRISLTLNPGYDRIMVRYRRNLLAGGTYFFTVTLEDRTLTALVDHINALRESMRTTRRAHPFTIDAVVVLPDHLHIVMTLPPGDSDFSTRWSLIKRGFTTSVVRSSAIVARHRNGEYALWQRRYWEHTIRDDEDFERHVDYIHFNPVKHGHVGRVRDWPHSSFHAYVKRGLLPEDWGGDIREVHGRLGER
jgi:putative transposase